MGLRVGLGPGVVGSGEDPPGGLGGGTMGRIGGATVGDGGGGVGEVVGGFVGSPASGSGTASITRVAAKKRDHITGATFTTSPLLGACTIRPSPT